MTEKKIREGGEESGWEQDVKKTWGKSGDKKGGREVDLKDPQH